MSRPTRVVLYATAALLAALLAPAAYLYIVDSRTVWRIGFHHTEPFLFPDPSGNGPTGFGKAVFEMAAAQAGIKLQWVYVPEGAAAAFQNDKIDLWARSTIVPGFVRARYVTSPWFHDAYGLVIRAQAQNWGAPAIVATGPSPFTKALAVREYPNASVVSAKSIGEAMKMVCDEKIDAALADLRQLMGFIMSGEHCRPSALRAVSLPGLTFEAGIGSSTRAAFIAERLRWQIDNLAASGELSRLHAEWYLAAPNELYSVEHNVRLSRRNYALGALAIALAIALLAVARFAAHARHSQEAADRANRAKSAFLAAMSHEIRTPMNGVLGSAQILRSARLAADQREMVETIYGSSEALLSILNDILDFSKSEAGEIAIRLAPLSLDRLITDCRATLLPLATAKEITLNIDSDATAPPYFLGDYGRLRQVLLNLAGNGVKFTATGSVTIRARAKEPGRLRFSVIDTGPGIAPADLARLFLPFTQLDGGATRTFGGTGLGLAISKHLITAMHGEIGVESEVGRGSEFWFELPIEAAVETPKQPTAPAPGKRGLRLLGVEDNAVNQLVLSRLLEKLGHSIILCPDGASAVERFGSGTWDAVLMDCHMPKMNGFEAARRIRDVEAGSGRRTPIIAMTASVLDRDREQCTAAGMDDFVPKPIVLDVLESVLARQCG